MKSAMRSAVIQTMQQTSESRKEHDRSNNGRADDGTSRAEDGTLRASLLHHVIVVVATVLLVQHFVQALGTIVVVAVL